MKLLEKMRKKKLLNEAFKKAGEPCWFVYYETNDGKRNEVRVFANKESEAREKASEMIKSFVDAPFVIIGTAAI